jgi:hypothetical protein
MRKLLSAGALLFVLGVALFSRPAAALAPCDCGFCATHLTVTCFDAYQRGVTYTCSNYRSLFCP